MQPGTSSWKVYFETTLLVDREKPCRRDELFPTFPYLPRQYRGQLFNNPSEPVGWNHSTAQPQMDEMVVFEF
jgi:hypothetical protein